MLDLVPAPAKICCTLLLSGVLLFNSEAAGNVIEVDAGWSVTSRGHIHRGNALLDKGDYENARRNFDAAIRAEPDSWVAYYDRAWLFAAQKKWTLARQDIDIAIRLKPTFLLSTLMRVDINLGAHNYPAALADLNQLVDLMHVNFDRWIYRAALNKRAWLRATCSDPSVRNGASAVADAKKVCQADRGENAGYVDTLAAAYAEAGDYSSAAAMEEKAIRMSKSAPNKKEFGSRLELYKKQHSYHES
jgi:tetratricopeptide (TPR) repeat protein